MAYSLVITQKAEELLDERVYYLLYQLKSEQAAKHLLDEVFKIYERLEENPFQFRESKDYYLKRKGYREAIISGMNYLLIFRVEEQKVYILGIFHELENYVIKL